MQRKLVWAADARRDLRDIFEFVAQRNLSAAIRLRAVIREGAERVSAMPLAYRPGRADATREAIVHPNYILVYTVSDDRVRLLRILHARQLYP